METLGLKKVKTVATELMKINPSLKTIVHCNHFDATAVRGADIVVDALDSARARRELAALCREQNLPLIHGAVKEWYGQVGIDQSGNELIRTLYPVTADSSPPTVKAMTVAAIAALQAAEICKLIVKKESPLHKAWLYCDLLHCDYELIQLSENQ